MPSASNSSSEEDEVDRTFSDISSTAPSKVESVQPPVAVRKTASKDDPIDKMVRENDPILKLDNDEIKKRTVMLNGDILFMRSELNRTKLEMTNQKERTTDNKDRIKLHQKLPYMVATTIEVFKTKDDNGNESESGVIRTTNRTSYFLQQLGLVEHAEVKPGDLLGVNKDTHIALERLPPEHDVRVKAMEVDEKPKDKYTDIGGLDKQLQELKEAVVLPITHRHLFKNLGIRPPKGVLLYGPPGTGKTMMARAVAAQTKATFLKLAGPTLVQMYIGEGARMVRDAFALAKEKAPAIIFIDEIDACGSKRFDSEKTGDREVQRTMLELLNQLDGFQPTDNIKVIGATNRIDILDPALVRSGRLDRKIELPAPDMTARGHIMKIHSRKMNVHKDVNFEELARCTDDFNGAQCRAVCVEAGMIALRHEQTVIRHEDFMDAIVEVLAKKKHNFKYMT